MNSSTPIRQIVLPYTAWWLFWSALQAIVLHRLNINLPLSVFDALISNFVLALAGYIIVNTFRFYSPAAGNYLNRFGYVLVLTLIYTAAVQWLLQQLYVFFETDVQFLITSLPARFMFSLLMISFIAVVSWLRFYMNDQEENKKRKNEAEQLLRDAELAKLRQQLQPHFLFNSLNSISALAGSQPEAARKMIQQLSDFLRGTLKKDEQQLVSFSEEILQLELYLEIEKVRFGHRLNTVIEYDEPVLKMKLPSLLLQPVVENAIKFGLYDTTEQITITIHAETRDHQLVIKIQNPYDDATTKTNNGTGFGLNSIQRRLYLLYARHDLLSVEQKENQFIATLKIPQNL